MRSIADHQQAGVVLLDVFADRLIGLARHQFGDDHRACVFGHRPGDIQMRLIDFGDAVVDQFLVQLLLLLEAEDLARLLVQNPGDLVEGDIVVIGVISRHHMHWHTQPPADIERGQQRPERFSRAVHADHDRSVADWPPAVPGDQHVDWRAPHDALADRADHAARDRTEAQRPHGQNIEFAGVHRVHDAGIVLALGAEALERNLVFLANDGGRVVVAVRDQPQPHADQVFMDIALMLHLRLALIALGQAALHLLEAAVMQLGGIGVDAGDGAPG
jgi:hypothetical protein